MRIFTDAHRTALVARWFHARHPRRRPPWYRTHAPPPSSPPSRTAATPWGLWEQAASPCSPLWAAPPELKPKNTTGAMTANASGKTANRRRSSRSQLRARTRQPFPPNRWQPGTTDCSMPRRRRESRARRVRPDRRGPLARRDRPAPREQEVARPVLPVPKALPVLKAPPEPSAQQARQDHKAPPAPQALAQLSPPSSEHRARKRPPPEHSLTVPPQAHQSRCRFRHLAASWSRFRPCCRPVRPAGQ